MIRKYSIYFYPIWLLDIVINNYSYPLSGQTHKQPGQPGQWHWQSGQVRKEILPFSLIYTYKI